LCAVLEPVPQFSATPLTGPVFSPSRLMLKIDWSLVGFPSSNAAPLAIA
jgi:hypothetical protein